MLVKAPSQAEFRMSKKFKGGGGTPTGGGTDPQFFVVQWVRILVKYVKNSIFGQKNFWWWGAPNPPPIATDMWIFWAQYAVDDYVKTWSNSDKNCRRISILNVVT